MSIIKTVDICKKFAIVEAVKNVSVTVEPGEVVAVIGPSGSGKSTLLHVMGFLDNYDGGEYVFEGKSLSAYSSKELAVMRNRKVGFVLQSYGLILGKNVYDNIAIPLLLNNSLKYKEINKRINDVLERLDISDKKRINVELLSGGQQQRVAIARSIVNQPLILLADEPTGALDSSTGSNIMILLKMLNTIYDMTTVIVTHDTSIAECCDRIVYIKDGIICNNENTSSHI